MVSNEKIVHFDKYCHKCEHVAELGTDGFENAKCAECLENPVNYDSHKPVNYKEAT